MAQWNTVFNRYSIFYIIVMIFYWLVIATRILRRSDCNYFVYIYIFLGHFRFVLAYLRACICSTVSAHDFHQAVWKPVPHPFTFFFIPFSCPVIRAHNAMTKEISLFFSSFAYRSNSLQLVNMLLPTNDDNNNNINKLIHTHACLYIISFIILLI